MRGDDTTLARLVAGVAAAGWPALARPVQRRSLDDPLRLAADDALVDSGLAGRLQRAFGRETGVAVQLLPGPASEVLQALERGEHDAALTNAPETEAALEQQGLVHDRRRVATGEFMLVGPAALATAAAAPRDVLRALKRLADAGAPFLSRHDGSGTHLAELALWRAARLATVPAWYAAAAPDRPLLAQVRARNACALVERGAWLAQGGIPGYADLAGGDPLLAVDIRVMRSFRGSHPAAKLFVGWVGGGRGHRVAAAVRGYRAPAS